MPKVEMALYRVLENCILGDGFRYADDIVKYKKLDVVPHHLEMIKSSGNSEVIDLTAFVMEREGKINKSFLEDDTDDEESEPEKNVEETNKKVEETSSDDEDDALYGDIVVKLPKLETAKKDPAKLPKKTTKAKAKKTTKKAGMTKKHMGITKPKNVGDLTKEDIASFVDRK